VKLNLSSLPGLAERSFLHEFGTAEMTRDDPTQATKQQIATSARLREEYLR
jgi:hypothetical protein